MEDPDPHNKDGSGSRGPNLRIRIHNTGTQEIENARDQNTNYTGTTSAGSKTDKSELDPESCKLPLRPLILHTLPMESAKFKFSKTVKNKRNFLRNFLLLYFLLLMAIMQLF